MVVPDGWFNYTCFGEPIRDTRILAAKTPLKQSFNSGENRSTLNDDFRRVALEEEFTPIHLMDMLEKKQLSLGLVIDLTFTKRYYSPSEFKDRGVKHVKILCPGRDIPGDDVYNQFAGVLNAFLADPAEEGKLVAVHCTHGLNRTGYLVCRYLLQECHYNIEDAIDAFNHARGHCIERKNYLDHLRMGCPKLSQEPIQSNGGVSDEEYKKNKSSHHSSLSYRSCNRSCSQSLRHTQSHLQDHCSDSHPSVCREQRKLRCSRSRSPSSKYGHIRDGTISAPHANGSLRSYTYRSEEHKASRRYEDRDYCSQQKRHDQQQHCGGSLEHMRCDYSRYTRADDYRRSSDVNRMTGAGHWEPRPAERLHQYRCRDQHQCRNGSPEHTSRDYSRYGYRTRADDYRRSSDVNRMTGAGWWEPRPAERLHQHRNPPHLRDHIHIH